MAASIVSVPLPGERVRPLLQAATTHDGVEPFSEDFERGLSDAQVGHVHLIIEADDGSVLAVAAVAPDGSTELVVHPSRRREGYGTALINAVRQETPNAGFWAHGDLPAAREVAVAQGLKKTRELLVMAVDSGSIDRGIDLPEGYRFTSYAEEVAGGGKGGVDKQLLEVNNDAFSWHPEQGGWDAARLERAMDTSWFDDAGLLLLWAGEDLAGFHWTKRHDDGTGEVYVVGLASRYRGEGLGVPLLQAGLEYLCEVGSQQVILYVEADNEAAVGLYERSGFKVTQRHVVYR